MGSMLLPRHLEHGLVTGQWAWAGWGMPVMAMDLSAGASWVL